MGSILEAFETLALQSNLTKPLTISHNQNSLSPESHQRHRLRSSQALMTLIWLTAIGKVKTKSNVPNINSNTVPWRPIDHFTDQTTCAQSRAPGRDSLSISFNQYRSHHSRNKLLPYMLFLVTFLAFFHLAGANIRLAPKYHCHQNREPLTIPSFDPKVHCSVNLDQITENMKYFNADVRQPYYRRIPINSYHSAISGEEPPYKTTIELHPETSCYSNTFHLYHLHLIP